MAGQFIKVRLGIFLTFSSILVVLSGCYCSFGWGNNVISKKSYFPQKSWRDSTLYFDAMNQLRREHPLLVLDYNDKKEYPLNRFSLKDSSSLFTEINCPTCMDHNACICVHSWYLVARKGRMVFNIGLYNGGFAIKEVYMKRGDSFLLLSQYDLCDMRKKDRQKLYKEITDCFEVEILPVMKPYFENE